ncbi:protein kinase, partial [Streptomyces longwoodensis]
DAAAALGALQAGTAAARSAAPDPAEQPDDGTPERGGRGAGPADHNPRADRSAAHEPTDHEGGAAR